MKLQLYVVRQLLVAFAFALGGIGFLVFPGITIQAVHKLEGAGLSALLVFIPMVAIELVPYLVPIAFLLGVVATFGRLAAENEWTAIRMSGTNPAKLLVPPALLALGLSAGTAWIIHELAPTWKYEQRDFKNKAQRSATALLRGGRTEIEVGGFFLKAQENPADYTYRRVLLYIPEDEAAPAGRPRYDHSTKIAADEAVFRVGEEAIDIRLVRPRVIRGSLDVAGDYIDIHLNVDDLFQHRRLPQSQPKYLPSSTLVARLDSPASTLTDAERDEYATEVHRRTAFAVTYFLFLLLGFPTGIGLRRGSQLAAFAVAVGFAVVYYVLSLRLGKELAVFGFVPPWLGAWSTNVLGAAAGLWATWRTLRR